jgi:general secretion pathway protein A
MYDQYWKFQSRPFEDTTDPNFFFRSRTHQAALLKLRYLVENNKGSGLLVGGMGLGKTMIAKMLSHELPNQFGPMIHVVFPQLSPAELLAYIAVELGAEPSSVGSGDVGLDRTIRQIKQRLEVHFQQSRHPIIVIDEAHLISDTRVFQTLQLLLNFQQQPSSEFTLILMGERSLLSRIARAPQLNDRIAVKSLLQPLSYSETAEYVNFRLEVAGSSQRVFDEASLVQLYELSGGVPRKINRICDLALLVGFADGRSELSATELLAASDELTSVVSE